MDPELKKTLKDRVRKIAHEFKITDILVQSFYKQMTPKLQVSAADVSYSIGTLIEHPKVLTGGQADPDNEHYEEQIDYNIKKAA